LNDSLDQELKKFYSYDSFNHIDAHFDAIPDNDRRTSGQSRYCRKLQYR